MNKITSTEYLNQMYSLIEDHLSEISRYIGKLKAEPHLYLIYKEMIIEGFGSIEYNARLYNTVRLQDGEDLYDFYLNEENVPCFIPKGLDPDEEYNPFIR